MSARAFLTEARQAYARVNRRTLAWMLDRPLLRGVFLNTKQSSITLRDYDASDGWKGSDFLYGWIQGRGLEALMTHAAFFEKDDPTFAARLRDVAAPLYRALNDLQSRDGHAYFTYDAGLSPVWRGPNGEIIRQSAAGDLYTYSDIFVAKGLLAASALFDPASMARHADFFSRIVDAAETNRFVIDERQELSPRAIAAQPDEFGPRMILLGGAGLLRRLGLGARTAYADRFITHVLQRHHDVDPSSRAYNLLRDTPGGDVSNPGHAIEFVGFAMDYLTASDDPMLTRTLRDVLVASFAAGFSIPGLHLAVSTESLRKLSPFRPWWSLPETMRTAALVYARTRDNAALDVWRMAHDAFFAHYWREDAGIAYQTMTREGPADFTPATPDLDPGYHTGLSFLGAIEAIDGMLNESEQ